MSETPVRSRRLPSRLWLAALLVWTLALIAPANWFPGGVNKPIAGTIGPGKLLHVAAYAVLAGAAGWLPLSRWARMMVIVSLFAHGGFTELMQTIAPGREGCWRDVGIDAVGVTLGWLATWRFWPSDGASKQSADLPRRSRS